MREIKVPALNANDERCLLLRWYVRDGDMVRPDTRLATLETSKAAAELEAECSGILQRNAKEGEEVDVGTVIARAFDSEADRQAWLAAAASRPTLSASDLIVTDDAQALIVAHGISEATLKGLGKRLIRRQDVESIIRPDSSQAIPPLSRRQASIARTVSRSHGEIPASFLVMRVWSDTVFDALRKGARSGHVAPGLAEVLVKCTADQCDEFPVFFCPGPSDEGGPVKDPNVGVTLDLGNGLAIPVVKSVRSKSLFDVAEALLELKEKALDDTYDVEDLSGGHISISLNDEEDCVLSVPIILPGQTCMLSLTGTQRMLVEAPQRGYVSRSYFDLGVCFDHRYINGQDAAQFLRGIKTLLESPDVVQRYTAK